ncbi:hypothetical protein H8356DRAFT_1351840 [Neocallimastix lanati (nom. inval.)]|nr:hypothetical protein H8356DRAFT_1351840 [Neocallimastix sp. JGI-2020a]
MTSTCKFSPFEHLFGFHLLKNVNFLFIILTFCHRIFRYQFFMYHNKVSAILDWFTRKILKFGCFKIVQYGFIILIYNFNVVLILIPSKNDLHYIVEIYTSNFANGATLSKQP